MNAVLKSALRIKGMAKLGKVQERASKRTGPLPLEGRKDEVFGAFKVINRRQGEAYELEAYDSWERGFLR